MSNILDEIVAWKCQEIDAAKRRMPLDELEAQALEAPPVRDFRAAIEGPGPIRLIAEVKKASPSAGVLRENFDPITIARTYEAHGAACLSVLTDAKFFQGHLTYLARIRAAAGQSFSLQSRQLWSNGSEICVVGLRATSQVPSSQRARHH